MKQDKLNIDLESNKFLLHNSDYFILMAIEKVLEKKFSSAEKAKKHLGRHFTKYLYVIDFILEKNLRHGKSKFKSQVVSYGELEKFFNNKKPIELGNGNNITLPTLILTVLIESKMIKRTVGPISSQGIASEYKVIFKKNSNRYDWYPYSYIRSSSSQFGFLEKIVKRKEQNLQLDSKVKERMNDWMEKLDFSRINKDGLKEETRFKLELFQTYKFQTQGKIGRIYNSFTNLPRIIRDKTIINGYPLGQIDLANAQAIFLSEIVLDYLNRNGIEISKETNEFIHWSELGKCFEFIIGGNAFTNSSRRTAFKKRFWKCIMSNNEDMPKYAEEFELMEKHIPQITQVVQKIKEKDHSLMARMLQHAESKLMMSVFDNIMGDFTCSLLHDAVYFPSNIWKEMSQLFIQDVKSRGVKCTVNVEYKFDGKFKEKHVNLTFVPNQFHQEIIQNNIELFKDYPVEHLSKNRTSAGNNFNESYLKEFEKWKSSNINNFNEGGARI